VERLLIVDDEEAIRSGIREYAEFEGYTVDEARDGAEAMRLCHAKDYDVIIMDIMMPGIDGFTAYKEIKKKKDIPVIMLSARGEEYDKLYGFELGIDDYVVKPFSLKELMARVKVLVRRHGQGSGSKRSVLQFGGLVLNPSGRWVSINGQRVDMTPKEYDLLFFLAGHEDIVFSREELLEKIWGFDFYGDGRTVDSHIKMLRHSLGEYRSCIVTYRGVGYKFEGR
jgi:DNA-binding response OmpR family regulator